MKKTDNKYLISTLAFILFFFINIERAIAMPDMNPAFDEVVFKSSMKDKIKLSQYKGKIILVFFGYTHCPDVCPLTLMDIKKTLDGLGEKAVHVQPVFISVDYKRDNPETLDQYTKFFDKRILGITADKNNIDKINKFFRTTYALLDHTSKDYLVEHSSNLYIIDQDLYVKKILPSGLPSSEIIKVIQTLF